jgi:deazaflavin-dependent oxidoreductase (nitroreductase family)
MQMSRSRAGFIRFVTRLHAAIFTATGGRVLGRAGGMPVLMLTTTGRKSGKKQTCMLTSPVQLGDALVLVASYGGNDRHPAWYLNLREQPLVDVVTSSGRGPMRARLASREERDALWPRVTAAYGSYAAYQERTRREIPLVVLEPIRAHA